MRSAIVPSPSVSLLASLVCWESVSSCGGEGAWILSSIVSSISLVSVASSCVGAAGGAAYGTGGVARGAGGVGLVSHGNDVSMKRACGET
eukprot:5019905-Pleurochrysis_carterae.AAC.1